MGGRGEGRGGTSSLVCELKGERLLQDERNTILAFGLDLPTVPS